MRLSLRSLVFMALIFLAAVAFTSAQDAPPKPSEDRGAVAEAKGKKLVMKDGSYQIIREYQLLGERVRYYSMERSDWEEVPAAMVDWDATRKEEAEESAREQQQLEKLRALTAAQRAEAVDVDASLMVAPDVFLPPGEGMFVVDGKAVFPLLQAEASDKLNKGRLVTQILVPLPVVPGKRTVELPGKQAQFRLTNGQPEFYMRTADAREPDVVLIHAEVKGNIRKLENIQTFFTDVQESRQSLPIQRWQVAKGVYRFTLGAPLPPGEYALAEIVPEHGMNLFVWDFGIDAAGTPARTKK